MMNPQFSIIIPHKDIPDLLMRCLESIPISEDIQIVVVDDNSSDADTYLERYPELSRPYLEFIRTTKGGGAGYARNVGLEHAKGKWLLFADADDFFVEDMYDIISSYIDSEADVIFFKKKSVLSENTSIKADRCAYINQYIDQYLSDGDEWPIRYNMNVPWGKMVRRELISKNNIRFDEVKYSNDVYFSLLVGYYAGTIEAINRVLYVVTSRSDSLTADFCSKPNELRIRAEECFRSEKFLFQHHIGRESGMPYYMDLLLGYDRPLYKHYLRKVDEIYPSKLSALREISKDMPPLFKMKFYLYALLIWMRFL